MDCKAFNKLGKCKLEIAMEVKFEHEGEDDWCKITNSDYIKKYVKRIFDNRWNSYNSIGLRRNNNYI